jgi:hypothetical protein
MAMRCLCSCGCSETLSHDEKSRHTHMCARCRYPHETRASVAPGERPGGPESSPGDAPGDTRMSARGTSLGRPAGMKECDDCMQQYPGPAYYTFHPRDCKTSNHRGEAFPHVGCTGNLCPRCAGPDLEPDRPDDPRRPS